MDHVKGFLTRRIRRGTAVMCAMAVAVDLTCAQTVQTPPATPGQPAMSTLTPQATTPRSHHAL